MRAGEAALDKMAALPGESGGSLKFTWAMLGSLPNSMDAGYFFANNPKTGRIPIVVAQFIGQTVVFASVSPINWATTKLKKTVIFVKIGVH